MKIKHFSLVCASLGMLGVAPATALAQAAPATKHAQGRILIQARAGLPDRELDRILAGAGARRSAVMERINVHVATVPAGREATVAAALARNPHINFAEVDALVQPSAVDPGLSSQWYLQKTGVTTAWSGATGSGLLLAVCDTGIRSDHPDLYGQIELPGFNTVDGTTNSSDANGHGTAVAGTFGMLADNGIGGKGIAFSARILPVRVSNTADGSAYVTDIAECITYAADRGARGANASYGVCGSSTVISAANYLRNTTRGVVTVSAGNSGSDPGFAANSAITCVSATDSNDKRTTWSSFGRYVDVAAPGASIYTTSKDGAYTFINGTSFSAPITLGVYGLMMSANPLLSSSQLDQILFSSTRDLGTTGYDIYYGHGRIDAAKAVSLAAGEAGVDATSPSVAMASPAANARVSGLLAVDVNASDNVGVSRVDLYVGGAAEPLTANTPVNGTYRFSVDTLALSDGPLNLRAEAIDAAGNKGVLTRSVTVGNDTVAPVVAITNPLAGSKVSGTISVTASAQDNLNQLVQLSLKIDGAVVATSTSGTISHSWRVCPNSKNCKGTATLTAEATDAAGNKGVKSISVTRSR